MVIISKYSSTLYFKSKSYFLNDDPWKNRRLSILILLIHVQFIVEMIKSCKRYWYNSFAKSIMKFCWHYAHLNCWKPRFNYWTRNPSNFISNNSFTIKEVNFQVNPFSIYYMIWTYIYFVAISLFIDDMNSSCNSENTTLTEIRKYILHNDQRRPLCRTKLTLSMSRDRCEKTIVELEYYCQHPDEYKANIFFHGMILKLVMMC